MKLTHTKNRITVCLVMLCISILGLQAADQNVNPQKPALLPLPQSLTWKEKSVTLNKVKVSLPVLKGDKLRARQLKTELKSILDRNNITVDQAAQQQISLRLGRVKSPEHWDGQGEEAYDLIVGNRGVILTANTINGLYRGVQTLRQLIVRKDGKTTLALCEIHDYPAFKIRGFMHDVGRNFQTLEQLKMQIDVMAKYKYSVFHWHLTEYHGWRLESKIYPKLTAPSSHTRYPGKHYTQKEFVEFVDYCWARGMIVIPEFDSPGHSDAFMKGVGIKNMKDPKALKAITELFDELCALVPAEKMPYMHVGTDEVRHKKQHVNKDYLRLLHDAIYKNDREVIGWWKGMVRKGQIQQTWAQVNPRSGHRHIDSRSNYVNHLEALDFAPRMFFQQPCRVKYGNKIQLGGILAHWPDTRVEDEKLTLTNNPIIPAMVAYSEAVWTGVKTDHEKYWAKLPPVGSPEFDSYVDFEERLAEQRDRFMSEVPFPMVKTNQIEWRLLGPVADGEVPALEKVEIKDRYKVEGNPFNWTEPIRGAAIHSRHFFSGTALFSKSDHFDHFPKGKDIVWGNTFIYSPKDQTVDAWIGFNTISSSDDRAGAPRGDNWGTHGACNIWINGKRVSPPKWKTNGKRGKEEPLVDQVYSSREPTKITLKKGWNPVLVKSARRWKWVFSFSPVEKVGQNYREVEGLKYSATPPSE